MSVQEVTLTLTRKEAVGADTEARFFKAVNAFRLPEWVLGVEQASIKLDIRGVDAIAQVQYLDGSLVDVPIQVKGHKSSVEFYYQKHPEARWANVVVIVVGRRDTDNAIHDRLITLLHDRRVKNTRYEEYFRSISRPITGRALGRAERMRQIREAQARTAAPAPAPEPVAEACPPAAKMGRVKQFLISLFGKRS